jgi:serine/threonine protein kinase
MLLARLGGGGMGRVFLGQSPGGRLVAVKLIRPELAENPDFRARFAREVAAARLVSGIFTAPVVDADPDGPQPWLVTAYVAGQSLTDAVLERGPLAPASVLTLAAGLAEGLDAIHAAGVVHRDLKPSNVILAADGPRIIDFGISKAEDAVALTHAGWVAGSPGFMSPEQAEGHPAGPPSDIFTLGAVLTFAATGEGPFGTGSPTAMLYRVVHSAPALGGMPDQLRFLVERCLEKDPARRPTAEQILAEPGLLPAADWPQACGVADGTNGLRAAAIPWTPAAAQGWSSGLPALASLAAASSPAEPGQPGPRWSPSQPSAADSPNGTANLARPSQQTSLDYPTSPDELVKHAGVAGRADMAGRPTNDASFRRRLGTLQPSACRERAHGGRHESRPGRSRTVARVVVAIAAVIAVAAATTAAVELHRAPDPPPAGASPQTVVREYFAAINARDWPEVWRLGGRNFSPSMRAMITGYSTTRRDVLTSIDVKGELVQVRLLAYETTGAVRKYALTYRVHRGVITAGSQLLLTTWYPAA